VVLAREIGRDAEGISSFLPTLANYLIAGCVLTGSNERGYATKVCSSESGSWKPIACACSWFGGEKVSRRAALRLVHFRHRIRYGATILAKGPGTWPAELSVLALIFASSPLEPFP
jgi:hypothetical protein